MENDAGIYVILSLGGSFTFILALGFYLWTARIRTEMKELKQQLSALLEKSIPVPARACTPAGTAPRAQLCSQCGKEGKTDDLMCVYCHTPFYN